MVEEFGYAGKILRVDLSSGRATEFPTKNYADRFLGGRGIAAGIYWDEVNPGMKAFDPENRLIFITGPLAGFPGLASSRWQICGKSPALIPEQFHSSNLGGRWGAELKFAGYDGIVLQGKAEKPVYLKVEDGTAEIRDASGLWGKSSVEVREILKTKIGSSISVVATGPAGDNLVTFAGLLADDDSSGSSGFGAVMGSKYLKAIAVRGSGKVHAADPERLRDLVEYAGQLKKVSSWEPIIPGAKKKLCYGCINGCMRGIYRANDGKKGKSCCQSAIFYARPAAKYYGGENEVHFYANRLCDEYGLDTIVVDELIDWLSSCYEAGILTDENTGLPISKMGSLEFIESMVKKISLRDGFGDILALGVVKAADRVGGGAKDLIYDIITRTGKSPMYACYDPRTYITTGLLYAMDPGRPIAQLHEISQIMSRWVGNLKNINQYSYLSSYVIREVAKRFWGGELAADFSTYKGKALAAKKIQDRQYAKECLILCDLSWPITDVEFSEDHVGDPTIESKIFSSVVGKELDEEGLYHIGEIVFNLQRAILAREAGRGRENDVIKDYCFTVPIQREFLNRECQVPGKEGEVISRRGAMLDREKFEKMKDEYYQLRGWDVKKGVQRKDQLLEIGLQDIALDLEQRRLIE